MSLPTNNIYKSMVNSLNTMFKNIDILMYMNMRWNNDNNNESKFYDYLDINKFVEQKLLNKMLHYNCQNIYIDTNISEQYIYGFLEKRNRIVNLNKVVQKFIDENKFLYKIRKQQGRLTPANDSLMKDIDRENIILDVVNLDVEVYVKQLDYGPYLYYIILLPQCNEYKTNEYYSNKYDPPIIENSNQIERKNYVSNNYIIKNFIYYVSLTDNQIQKEYTITKLIRLVDDTQNFIKLPKLIMNFFSNVGYAFYKNTLIFFLEKLNKMTNYRTMQHLPVKRFRQLLVEVLDDLQD